MLLNKAKTLRVLYGRALRMLELAHTELHWITFESWVWLYGDRIFEAPVPDEGGTKGRLRGRSTGTRLGGRAEGRRFSHRGGGLPRKWYNGIEGSINSDWYTRFPFIMAFSPIYNTREIADYVRESFVWRWRRASRPPCPLPEDFHAICPYFSLPEVVGAAANFELLEMVQATFYTMQLNQAVELGVVRGFMAKGLTSALAGLRWSSFEFREQAVAVEICGPLDNQEECSNDEE
ncbi:hypothetical protein Cgig2_027178 [Carnegiea gigantea]|uniref:Uncharacterized protein n=1 Tax=Carnegiea gigantea TaxID=171969 RepID=A0A9Q1QPP4_9CARY|nr:hypothetical protein Cgig2_027178 [Carnegiea gigantea]